ncbi:MAG TPA: ferrous iron transport protein B [Gemmataceae bacterium]|nr:ferrous iron transport protein B [Gemmataceae bacterium]
MVGNPNTGKTTLFNALAGMRQRVGNYPGVTVETKKGRMTYRGQTFDLIDLPGTYSLAPRSPDEMVAVDLILGQLPGEPRPDVVVSIVDASNLERNLYLTTQVMELGVPVVVALNMIDIAQAQGLRIDAERLSKQLGVPVVPIQANKGRGLERLKSAIADCGLRIADCPDRPVLPRGVQFPEAFEREIDQLAEQLGGHVPRFLVRRLLLDVGGYVESRLTAQGSLSPLARLQAASRSLHRPADAGRSLAVLAEARQRLAEAGCPVPGIEARARYAWIREATVGCVERPRQRPITWTDRLDRVLTHKVWGTLVFLVVMFVVFQAIFTWARPLMDLIDQGKNLLAGFLSEALPRGPLASLLIDGVLEGVGSVVIFLPQILILFAFLAVLEDCGYMARAAFLMDKLMARCGLSGKSFIPMLSSVACAVPGIMATRVIENRRDRLATIVVAPLMSCSARLPVYTLLIGAFLTEGYSWWVPGLTMFSMYAIGLVTAPLVALALKRTLLRGETPVFVMEMPLYKWPSPGTVLRRMTDSGWAFLRRAGTVILASMIVIWALLYFPNTNADGQSYEELIAQAEGSPERVHALQAEWTERSILGRVGHAIEPAVRPLGWDWKIGTAALASFPAREVVVGTLGIIYNLGKVDAGEIEESDDPGGTALGQALRAEQTFTVPVALSLMVFFALCCQCASTLAVIRRETNSWRWPLFTFTYMTVLAYLGALVVYQVGSLF